MYTTPKGLDPLDNHVYSMLINRGIVGFSRQPVTSLGIDGSAIFPFIIMIIIHYLDPSYVTLLIPNPAGYSVIRCPAEFNGGSRRPFFVSRHSRGTLESTTESINYLLWNNQAVVQVRSRNCSSINIIASFSTPESRCSTAASFIHGHIDSLVLINQRVPVVTG